MWPVVRRLGRFGLASQFTGAMLLPSKSTARQHCRSPVLEQQAPRPLPDLRQPVGVVLHLLNEFPQLRQVPLDVGEADFPLRTCRRFDEQFSSAVWPKRHGHVVPPRMAGGQRKPLRFLGLDPHFPLDLPT